MGSNRQLAAHAIAARAQAELPADPGRWVSLQMRQTETEIGRLREYLRRLRKAKKLLDRQEVRDGE